MLSIVVCTLLFNNFLLLGLALVRPLRLNRSKVLHAILIVCGVSLRCVPDEIFIVEWRHANRAGLLQHGFRFRYDSSTLRRIIAHDLGDLLFVLLRFRQRL